MQAIKTIDLVKQYSRKTILRYAQRKFIYAANIMGKYYISKHSIINYLATDKAFRNTQKTEWHEQIIEVFTKTDERKAHVLHSHRTCASLNT